MSLPAQPVYAGHAPDPPELPDGVEPGPRWPWWYAPLGFVAAFAVAVFVAGLIGVVVRLSGQPLPDPQELPPWLNIVSFVVQDTILTATAVVLAARTLRPRLWHFGFQRRRFWPTVGWTALGAVGLVLFETLYIRIVQPTLEQPVLDKLGADQSTLALLAVGIVVIVLAPIAEEFFFRGFFYKALRTRLGVPAAAGIDGLLFGAIHIDGAETLVIAPVLAAFGVILCLVYERTGTLYAAIGLHALNNTTAYVQGTESSPAIPVAIGAGMLAACVVAARFTRERGGRPRPSRRPVPTGSTA